MQPFAGGQRPPHAPRGPSPVKRKGLSPRGFGGISGGVTVVLVGALVAASVLSSRDSMEDGVQRYFTALGKSYSDELADHVVNVPNAADLEEARKTARTQDYSVKDVRTRGNTAIVDYSVAGRAETVELEMRKVEGEWKVVDGFSKLTVKPSRKRVDFRVGFMSEPVGERTLSLYPGTYELQKDFDTGAPSYLWDISGDKYIILKPGESKSVDVEVTLTKAGTDRVRSAMGSAFSRCMNGSDVAPANCPFKVAEPSDRTSPYGRWTVETGNRFDVAQSAEIGDDQEFDSVCGTFRTDVTYEYRNVGGCEKIPAESKEFTGCVDLTERSPSVTWQ